MTIIQSLILGAVQGLTEFLPVSSSGHLVLVPVIFGWHPHTLAFDTVLHLGTASALVLYFFKDLLEVIKSRKLIVLLLIGSLPAGIIGFLFDSFFEENFRSGVTVAIFLLLGSILMIVAEQVYKKAGKQPSDQAHKENINDITYGQSAITGGFQTLALFPGISRSGSTISGGMILGFSRELAARFSFLLSIPVIVGAGLYKVADSYRELSFDATLFAGYLASFFVGMLAISFLLKFLKSNTLYAFVIFQTDHT